MSERNIDNDDLVKKISQLVQMLRVSMEELGLSKEIEKAAEAIPDTQDQLDYIQNMTEQAAHRALTAIDKIDPIFDEMKNKGTALRDEVKKADADPSLEIYRLIAAQAFEFAEGSIEKAQVGKKEVLEIIMAQDFQDLTGQVIKKLSDVMREVQHQLLQVIMESGGDGSEEAVLKRLAKNEWDDEVKDEKSLLNGPQIKPTAGDAVSGQEQVDSLLEDLGF